MDVISLIGTRTLSFALLVCAAVSFQYSSASELNTAASLNIQPSRCIALREGQTCYQTLSIEWQTPETGEYCLYDLEANILIHCWQQASQGVYEFEFEGNKSVQYVLMDRDKTPIAKADLEVNWVYKKQVERTSTWRLF